jgi:hypothetical protein
MQKHMQYLKSYQKKEIKFRIFSQIFFLLKNETKKQQQRHAYGKGNDI